MYRSNLKFVPKIIAIEVLGGVANPNLRKGGIRGSGMVTSERALVSSYRPFIVTFPLSLRVSEILPLFCSMAHATFPRRTDRQTTCNRNTALCTIQ